MFGERLPAGVLVQGLDTIKETFGRIEDALLQRGLATLTLEQPGSGEARRRGVCLTGLDVLEAAAHAVADVACTCPELDSSRLGLYGVSYGGFVAPYFAAVEPRFRALAVLGARWEFPHPRGMAANPFYGAVMRLMTGVDDRDGVTRIFEGLTLGPVAGRIVAATAILHGETDRLLVDAARRLPTTIHADTQLRMVDGGDHALTCTRRTTRSSPLARRPASRRYLARSRANGPADRTIMSGGISRRASPQWRWVPVPGGGLGRDGVPLDQHRRIGRSRPTLRCSP